MRDAGAATVALPYRHLRHSAGIGVTIRSFGRGVAAARAMRRVLRDHPERPVVYCTALRAGMVVAVAQIGLRRRSVWVVPDFLPPPPLRQLVRLLARGACRLALPLSQAAADDFTGSSRRLKARTRVVYPGVDLAEYQAQAAQPGAPRAAIVGHVSVLKHTDLAVEIARRVRAERPDFELDVFGRAQYRPEDFELERSLQAEVAADPSLRDHVHFRGKVADVAGALRDCGLLLHCRPDEPFGMVLVEAMAAGLPVVAPANAGPLEIVVPGETGLLYPPGDAAAAARAVLSIIGDPDQARRMGEAGRRRVEERFRAEDSLALVQRLLRTIH